MKVDVRKCTNKLVEMMDDGLLDAQTVAIAALLYLSEDEVKEMARINEFIDEEEEEEEE